MGAAVLGIYLVHTVAATPRVTTLVATFQKMAAVAPDCTSWSLAVLRHASSILPAALARWWPKLPEATHAVTACQSLVSNQSSSFILVSFSGDPSAASKKSKTVRCAPCFLVRIPRVGRLDGFHRDRPRAPSPQVPQLVRSSAKSSCGDFLLARRRSRRASFHAVCIGRGCGR